MATAEEIKARAREIMAQDLPEDYNPDLKDDEQLITEGGVDSLGFVHVLTKLEGEFGAHRKHAMKRRAFSPGMGVSNIELFYDLIFVYCISVLTSTMHHVHGDFFDLSQWLDFTFAYLVVLQVWFFTTFLMNRYGDCEHVPAVLPGQRHKRWMGELRLHVQHRMGAHLGKPLCALGVETRALRQPRP